MLLYFVFQLLFGVAVGYGLRYLGVFGRLIFWLVMVLQAGGAGLIITTIIATYRDAKRDNTTFKMPFGGLTEWAVMFTYFAGGLTCSYCFTAPWSMRNTAILGVVLFALIGAMIVFIRGMRGIRRR
ncbi:MAG: hypothetical protein JXA21_06600 [Anaerolineae bacterium]|nr:hypothetical protein [Anaerolineae bacterium]